MSEENVEIIRSLAEPLDGLNVAVIDWTSETIREVIGRAYSPDIELTTLASGLGIGVGEREWLEPFSDYHVDNLDYIAAGDCVLVPSRQWGIGAGSGARVELELTTLYELRDGRIVRVHQYDTLDDALEAAGLSE